MTQITFTCSGCNTGIEADPAVAGSTVQCPVCQADCVVPAPPEKRIWKPKPVESPTAKRESSPASQEAITNVKITSIELTVGNWMTLIGGAAIASLLLSIIPALIAWMFWAIFGH